MVHVCYHQASQELLGQHIHRQSHIKTMPMDNGQGKSSYNRKPNIKMECSNIESQFAEQTIFFSCLYFYCEKHEQV